MKQISNKEYEKYQQYQTDKLHGRILTPDGLRIICAGLDNDPELALSSIPVVDPTLLVAVLTRQALSKFS